MFGSMLVQFALVWWLTQKTGSATILATASLVAYLPQVFLGPFAGAIVDRTNRKAVMIIADSMVALTTLALVVITAFGMLAPWHIYVAMFLRSLGQAFHWPAMQASTSLLVPEEHLSRVAGINQALAGAMNIIAPPTGALLIGVLQLQWVLSIDILTAVLAILPLFFVHIPQPVRILASAGKSMVGSILEDIKEGFLYVFRWKGLVLCTSLCGDDQLPHQSGFHSTSAAGDQTFPWQCHSIRLDRISYRDWYRDRGCWTGSLGWL